MSAAKPDYLGGGDPIGEWEIKLGPSPIICTQLTCTSESVWVWTFEYHGERRTMAACAEHYDRALDAMERILNEAAGAR